MAIGLEHPTALHRYAAYGQVIALRQLHVVQRLRIHLRPQARAGVLAVAQGGQFAREILHDVTKLLDILGLLGKRLQTQGYLSLGIALHTVMPEGGRLRPTSPAFFLQQRPHQAHKTAQAVGPLLAVQVRNTRQATDEGRVTTAVQFDAPDLRIQRRQSALQGASIEMAIHLGEGGGYFFDAGRVSDHVDKTIRRQTGQGLPAQFGFGRGVELQVSGEVPGATGVWLTPWSKSASITAGAGMDSARVSQVAVLRVICLSCICMATGASMAPIWGMGSSGHRCLRRTSGQRSAMTCCQFICVVPSPPRAVSPVGRYLWQETLAAPLHTPHPVSRGLVRQSAHPPAMSRRASPQQY